MIEHLDSVDTRELKVKKYFELFKIIMEKNDNFYTKPVFDKFDFSYLCKLNLNSIQFNFLQNMHISI